MGSSADGHTAVSDGSNGSPSNKKRSLDDALSTKELSKAEKGKLKKKRKEEQRALENPPSFAFDTRGFRGGRQIGLKDVRDFVLHLLSDEKAQQWIFVANKRNIRKVVTLMVPGVNPAALGVEAPPLSANLPFALSSSSSDPSLPVFQKLFSHACPTKAPGDKAKLHSCYQCFTTCPLTGNEKDRREKARKEKGQKQATEDPVPYLLTPEQMREQGYLDCRASTSKASPTWQDWQRGDGWIETPVQDIDPSKPRQVYGLDCEMCLTEDGSELTRISLINMDGKNVYDKLVKPDKPITDYLTRFSGMDEKRLASVTTRLEDVQRDLSKIVSYSTILIGHSLECDLRVLKWVHPHVIDTSVLYQHPRGPPFKASLKWLAQKWLKKEIQRGGQEGGHDSEEDARTCVELLKLKMQKGPGFGEFATDQETIFERIARGTDAKTSAVVDHGQPAQWHGAKAKTAVACSTDEDVKQGIIDTVPDHHFVFARFMDLSHALGWTQPSLAAQGKTTNSGATATLSVKASAGETADDEDVDDDASSALEATAQAKADLASAYAKLNDQLAQVHASLPPATALIIFSGHDDPLEMKRLSENKARFDKLWKEKQQHPERGVDIPDDSRWLAEDDRALVDAVERCRRGLSFFCIK